MNCPCSRFWHADNKTNCGTFCEEVKTVSKLRELRYWFKFFRVLLRLTWQARREQSCRQKIRRIIRAAEKEFV